VKLGFTMLCQKTLLYFYSANTHQVEFKLSNELTDLLSAGCWYAGNETWYGYHYDFSNFCIMVILQEGCYPALVNKE